MFVIRESLGFVDWVTDSRFLLKNFLACYPCAETFLYRGPRVLLYKSDRRFSSNSFRIFTWKRCLLDKLNDSTKFQANPGSELKSQNTWRVWLVLSIILYNPDLSTPAALKSWQLLVLISQCLPKNGSGQEQLYRTLVGLQISLQVPPFRHGLLLQQPLAHVKSPTQDATPPCFWWRKGASKFPVLQIYQTITKTKHF